MAPSRTIIGLVPAAGRGDRFGGALPKQLLPVGGRPLLAWTLERLLAAGVERLTVALPAGLLDPLPAGLPSGENLVYVAGGSSRQESVARCLEASPGPPGGLVLVHDGARAAVAAADVRATIAAAAATGAAVLGRPLEDTLKRVAGGRLVATVDRRDLFRAETPQVFRRDLLERALALARADGFAGTDEASLVERLGDVPIAAVAAAHPNPKLTLPADLPLLAALLRT